MEPPFRSGDRRVLLVLLIAAVMTSHASIVGAAVEADTPPPAGPESRPAWLEVVAAPNCATRDDLVARVMSRSARVRFSADPGVGLGLRVEIVPGSGGTVAAMLEVGGGTGARARRGLVAATCDEALDALALMIVVLLDPTALIAPAASRSRLAALPPVVVAAGPPAPPLPPRRWGVVVEAAAHAISGPAPQATPGVAIGAAVASEPGTGHRFWSPAARLRWARDWLGDWQAPGGIAAFTLDSLELDLCPLAWGLWRVAVRACGTAFGTRVLARGSQTFSPESHVQYLVTLGAGAWLALPLAPHVAVEGSLAAGPSLRRDSFTFFPEVFYRVAPVTLVGSLGLALTFP